jgi:hypothetical protein
MGDRGYMTTWPLSIWIVLLSIVPFFVVYVIVTVIVFARVHAQERVRIRLKRPALGNAREGLEWKIPGIVIGVTWFLLITLMPIRFLGWFGIDVAWGWIGTAPLSAGEIPHFTRSSLTDFVIDGVLFLAMVIVGVFLSAWIHNLRIPAEAAPQGSGVGES